MARQSTPETETPEAEQQAPEAEQQAPEAEQVDVPIPADSVQTTKTGLHVIRVLDRSTGHAITVPVTGYRADVHTLLNLPAVDVDGRILGAEFNWADTTAEDTPAD